MKLPSDFLRLKVGFFTHQAPGYNRPFNFTLPFLTLKPDVEISDFSTNINITRVSEGLLTEGNISGNVQLDCVLCLDPFTHEVNTDYSELYSFKATEKDDYTLTFPEDGILDLTPQIREYILLSLPIKPVCSPICRGLCPVCGNDLNEVACEHKTEYIDPRFDKLKKLKLKD